jgi:acetyltransferase
MDNPTQLPSPIPPPEEVTLSDGSHIIIRPIQPEDADALQTTFGLLSAQSIYFRFMSHKKELTDKEAERFANVDYHTQMAFVAVGEKEGEPLILGVSRYALLDPALPDLAESAVVVGDEFQHRGVGKVLLWRLVQYARTQGIRYLRGVILLENQRMVELVKKGGLPYQQRYVDGYHQITIDIGSS